MKKRPDKSSLKDSYLQSYNSIETCLMQHNFGLLFPRKIENQIFDMLLTAQTQKVPAKKLQCNKNLEAFCIDLISVQKHSVTFIQSMLENIFSCFLLFLFFTLLDLIFEKGLLISTLMTCFLVSIGYLISNSILKYKNNYNNKLRISLILAIILIPFTLISMLKYEFAFMLILIPFNYSLLLAIVFFIVTSITYYILSKKYDLFIFINIK